MLFGHMTNTQINFPESILHGTRISPIDSSTEYFTLSNFLVNVTCQWKGWVEGLVHEFNGLTTVMVNFMQ